MHSEALLSALQACYAETDVTRIFSAIGKAHGLGRTVVIRAYKAAIKTTSFTVCSDKRTLIEHQGVELLRRLEIMALKRLYPTPTLLRNMAEEIGGYTPGRSGPPDSSNVMATSSRFVRVEGMEKSRHTARVPACLRGSLRSRSFAPFR